MLTTASTPGPPPSAPHFIIVHRRRLHFLTFWNMANRRNINRTGRAAGPINAALVHRTIRATAASIAQSVEMDNASHLVSQTNLQNRRVNTAKAYDPKKQEFLAFCDHMYAGKPVTTRYVVTEDKLYFFLFYQAYRSKKKGGGGKRKSDGSRQPHEFDPEDYDRVWSEFGSRNLPEGATPPDPENPLGFSMVNQYKAAVRKLYDQQRIEYVNNRLWENVCTPRVHELMTMVANRKRRIDRKNFTEKLDQEFTPFTTLTQMPEIEDWLWNHGKDSARSAFSALRNRFGFLQCFAGALRHEALFHAELSDLMGLIVPKKVEDDLFIFIMQMDQGKTIKEGGSRQLGRALRHKDVSVCPVGALGFYLFQRFRMTGEMEDGKRPDFCDNKDWFSTKLFVHCSQEDKRLEMKKKNFTDMIRECFASLKIFTRHYGHFGRVSAPALLELEEISHELIRILGNWDATIQEERYSSKIPVQALRVMAGFGASEKHFNPR